MKKKFPFCFNAIKVFPFLLLILIITSIALPSKLFATTTDNEFTQLEEKVAKGYSSKYCNAIGIGVSQEGAMRMAISENKDPSFNPSLWLELTFSGEKEIKEINQDRVSKLVAINVVNKCGYPIGLSGDSGIEEFEKLFKASYDLLTSTK